MVLEKYHNISINVPDGCIKKIFGFIYSEYDALRKIDNTDERGGIVFETQMIRYHKVFPFQWLLFSRR